jgi:hypothetical protein
MKKPSDILRYSMQEAMATTNLGTRHIVHYLSQRADTKKIVNVEAEVDYQKQDIDLLWHRVVNGVEKICTVEVKVDNYFRTGNYFLETISNVEKGTPGCFLYSQAHYLFYYFLGVELHIMQLATVRTWFQPRIAAFVAKRTSTPIGSGAYQTEGRLVNREQLQREVPDSVVIIKYQPDWGQ